MARAELDDLLASGMADLEIPGEHLDKIRCYLELLLKWNQRINLTGTRDARVIAMHHVLDSLAVAPHVPSRARRAIDVGSGAGLPGALVAIVRPELELTALEPIHKKHAFLSTVRRELALTNLRPVSERLEQHVQAPVFRAYDIAMSRATFSVPEWLERARPLVGAGGLILAMEGAERHALPPETTRHPYQLRGAPDRTRAILELCV